MRSSLAAAIVIVALTTGWLVTSGQKAVAAPTWADVAKQTQGINQVHIDVRTFKGSQLVQREELWIKSPATIRAQAYELVDGKAVPAEGSIATPKAGVRWDERTKLGEHTSTSNRYMMQSSAAGTIEAVLGVSLLADRPEANIKINGEEVRFEPVAQKHPEDAKLRGFKLAKKVASGPELPPPFTSLVYWFAERSNTLRRLSMTMEEGGEVQRSDLTVDLEPSVPANWLDVALPPDCIDVSAGVAPRLSPGVRAVYDQVAAAKKRFGDYRAVIWRDATGGWPSYREATRGGEWRCDRIDWTVMHTAVFKGNPQKYIKIGPEDVFAKLWGQVNRPDYELDMTAMTWRSKLAVLHYKLGGRGPHVSASLYDALRDGYEKFFAASLRSTAWPEWMWWENRQPHGWALQDPPLRWRLGPADAAHPERVQVIGERPKGFPTLVAYTFDREKEWLCIRQEWVVSGSDKLTWEITSFGRTADGLWYPRKAKILNSTYDYAVERGAAPASFFDYPKEMPQPVDQFEQFQARADQAASPQANVPATAKGKYVAIPSRGLPRGFDNKQQSEAHSEMVQKMDHISRRLSEFAHEHKWVYPERLQTLVDEGYLKPEDLRNPLHPDANPPYGYIRPNRDLPNNDERMVLYEPFDKWPGVATVVFQDHSAEYIHDKVHFDRLVQEATRREPPSRAAP